MELYLIMYCLVAVVSTVPIYHACHYLVKNDFPMSYSAGAVSPWPFIVLFVLAWPIGGILSLALLAEEYRKIGRDDQRKRDN